MGYYASRRRYFGDWLNSGGNLQVLIGEMHLFLNEIQGKLG